MRLIGKNGITIQKEINGFKKLNPTIAGIKENAEDAKGKVIKMNVTLKRTQHLSQATLGELTVGLCNHNPIYTLENPKRDTDKDSCIAAGIYLCKPYSGEHFKDVYIVENVPNRSAILFHWGNTEKDTLGCILLGNKLGTIENEPAVLESRACYERFRSLIGKNEFILTIED